ncbi:MAG: tyrosine-type recombinase/integrase [Oscillospiraceae bacterium]|nr:tyrosine-type recombinase/integrase [Oscillospiraceae bacterium]
MKIAVIRCVGDSEKLKYRSMKERFRHTLATNLINSGMEIQDVSVILGHANINTTMRYVHMSDKNTEKNYRKYTENRKEKKQ